MGTPESNIWLRTTHFLPTGVFTVPPEDGPFQFQRDDPILATQAVITISATGAEIIATADVSIPTELVAWLESPFPGAEPPGKHESGVLEFFGRVGRNAAIVLGLFRQEYRNDFLMKLMEFERLDSHFDWSADGISWTSFPQRPVVDFDLALSPNLTPQTARRIQHLLDRGEEPLVALLSLSEAYRNQNLRTKWIEAATAAELAIKEILIRVEPKLKVLLTELQAPPLQKLYGSVLEELAGESSPHRKALDQGAAKRNRLVHRPEQTELDREAVTEYLDTVREAIRHLLHVYRSGQRSRVGTGPYDP